MNLRKTAVCAALVLALTQAVQAEVSLKSEGKLPTVSGGCGESACQVVLIMLKEGVEYDDYKEAPSVDSIEYFWQTTADENGNFSFAVYLEENMKKGSYYIQIGGMPTENIVEKYELIAEADRSKNDVIKLINAAVNAGTVKELLTANREVLGISKSYTDSRWTSIAKSLLKNAGQLSLSNFDSYFKNAAQSAESSSPSGGGGGGGSLKGTVITGNTGGEALYTVDQAAGERQDFDDLSKEHYAYIAVMSMVEKGVLSGVGEKRFEPDRFVKREEFAQMLYKAFNVPDSDSTFEDVGKNEWFYKPVSACCGAGIIKGVSDSHFGSGASLTRQDACVMLYRLLGEPTVELEAEFADRESAAPYAKNAIDALYSMEVIRGTEDNRFMPQSELTRAQAAMIIYNISERNN